MAGKPWPGGTPPHIIDRNRRNSQRSTGPRTEAGKRRSRANAWQHGLFAKRDLIQQQAADEVAPILAELQRMLPHGVIPSSVVKALAADCWAVNATAEALVVAWEQAKRSVPRPSERVEAIRRQLLQTDEALAKAQRRNRLQAESPSALQNPKAKSRRPRSRPSEAACPPLPVLCREDEMRIQRLRRLEASRDDGVLDPIDLVAFHGFLRASLETLRIRPDLLAGQIYVTAWILGARVDELVAGDAETPRAPRPIEEGADGVAGAGCEARVRNRDLVMLLRAAADGGATDALERRIDESLHEYQHLLAHAEMAAMEDHEMEQVVAPWAASEAMRRVQRSRSRATRSAQGTLAIIKSLMAIASPTDPVPSPRAGAPDHDGPNRPAHDRNGTSHPVLNGSNHISLPVRA